MNAMTQLLIAFGLMAMLVLGALLVAMIPRKGKR